MVSIRDTPVQTESGQRRRARRDNSGKSFSAFPHMIQENWSPHTEKKRKRSSHLLSLSLHWPPCDPLAFLCSLRALCSLVQCPSRLVRPPSPLRPPLSVTRSAPHWNGCENSRRRSPPRCVCSCVCLRACVRACSLRLFSLTFVPLSFSCAFIMHDVPPLVVCVSHPAGFFFPITLQGRAFRVRSPCSCPCGRRWLILCTETHTLLHTLPGRM